MIFALQLYLIIGVLFTGWTFAWVAGDYKGPFSAFILMIFIWPYQLYLQLKYKGLIK